MSIISVPYTFSVGAVIVAAQHNSNFSTIYNDYSGNIQDVNIASNAAIGYAKLALTGSIVANDLATALSKFLVPSGGIIMWSGTIATIPSGWFLCDGTNSTPNLTNKFVVCASADSGGVAKTTITGSATQSGGSTTISTSNVPALKIIINQTDPGSNTGGNNSVQGIQASGSLSSGALTDGGTTPYIQPYYALAYIMKS